jgi:hypothetical protein
LSRKKCTYFAFVVKAGTINLEDSSLFIRLDLKHDTKKEKPFIKLGVPETITEAGAGKSQTIGNRWV